MHCRTHWPQLLKEVQPSPSCVADHRRPLLLHGCLAPRSRSGSRTFCRCQVTGLTAPHPHRLWVAVPALLASSDACWTWAASHCRRSVSGKLPPHQVLVDGGPALHGSPAQRMHLRISAPRTPDPVPAGCAWPDPRGGGRSRIVPGQCCRGSQGCETSGTLGSLRMPAPWC